ncbi:MULTISPECIES: hypothetical protein [unclassified Caulobacter]|uniref:hypothetical protein n=1 Tax=unclassified Caulobacter TaxID=2648921 RepID=UPI0009E8485B|nr:MULTISPECIES: hypothetical protein [unclassified Caulobacter]
MARWLGIFVTTAGIGASSQAHAATAADQLYERTLMTSADARCRLFKPAVGSALDAARAQARGATLRSGVSEVQVQAVEQRARAKAGVAACNSPDLQTAAGRVRQAFDGYSTMLRMTYPGDRATWQADRSVSATIPIWRLSQPAGFGGDRLVFGLSGRANDMLAVAVFADNAQPYTARLVVRDTLRTQGPYLNARNAKGLAANAAPRNASRVFGAETRDAAPPTLLPTGAKTGLSFRFPREAADAMSRLDPREAATVEFVFTSRTGVDVVRRAYVEVGDFAAGRAFLR